MLSSDEPWIKEKESPLELAEGEVVVLKGIAATLATNFGSNPSPLVLTSGRLVWNPPNVRHRVEIDLADITRIDRGGNPIDRWIGPPRFRVQLKNGKRYPFIMKSARERNEWQAKLHELSLLGT
jgi:hypothetical protein